MVSSNQVAVMLLCEADNKAQQTSVSTSYGMPLDEVSAKVFPVREYLLAFRNPTKPNHIGPNIFIFGNILRV